MSEFQNLRIVRDSGARYAYIQAPGGSATPCSAQAQGGDIDVECQADQPGDLIVMENSWDGWHASRDGNSVALVADQWLHVEAPAGTHHFVFRYRPWDVPIGLITTLFGLALAMQQWRRTSNS